MLRPAELAEAVVSMVSPEPCPSSNDIAIPRAVKALEVT